MRLTASLYKSPDPAPANIHLPSLILLTIHKFICEVVITEEVGTALQYGVKIERHMSVVCRARVNPCVECHLMSVRYNHLVAKQRRVIVYLVYL